jgi:hypothetical protein
MGKVLDIKRAEAALNRAAQRALHGTREERAGRVLSSALTEVKYQPSSRDLDIRFVTGRKYRYANVPPEMYERLLNAESKGTFFNAFIRDHYQHREL